MSVDRLVETRFLEVHTSGSSTNRVAGIESEFTILGSLRDSAQQVSSINSKTLL